MKNKLNPLSTIRKRNFDALLPYREAELISLVFAHPLWLYLIILSFVVVVVAVAVVAAGNQCDQIGLFLKILAKKVIRK